MMLAVDVNNNGTIDYSGFIFNFNIFFINKTEFLMASCTKKHLASKVKLESVFKMFDKVILINN